MKLSQNISVEEAFAEHLLHYATNNRTIRTCFMAYEDYQSLVNCLGRKLVQSIGEVNAPFKYAGPNAYVTVYPTSYLMAGCPVYSEDQV